MKNINSGCESLIFGTIEDDENIIKHELAWTDSPKNKKPVTDFSSLQKISNNKKPFNFTEPKENSNNIKRK